MVELSIPRQRLVTTEAPKDSISSRDYAASASAVGSGLQAIGSGLESIAVPLAEKKGKEDAAAAISYDADGKIVIGDPGTSFIWGRAGNAYASAKETEMLVAGRSQVDQDLIALRAKHEGNPQGFQKEAADYLNARKAANVGGIGQATFDYGMRASSGHYNNLVENRAARDFKQSSDVFNGRMATLQGQEESLIMQGVSSGAEWERIQAEKNQIRAQMEGNPRFNYNAQLRSLDEQNDRQRQAGLAISYEGRRRVDAGEPLAVVQKDIEERLIKAGMPSDQVQKYIGLASSHMAGVSARRGAELQRHTADADLAIQRMQGGDTILPAEYNLLLQNLGRNGGEKKAAELEFNRRMVEDWKPRMESGDATERAAVAAEIRQAQEQGVSVPGRVAGRGGRLGLPAAQGLTATEAGLLNAISGPESGGRYDVRYTAAGGTAFAPGNDHPRIRERIASGPNAGRTSDAAGRYQFLSSTWDSLPAEAKGDGRFTPENQDRAAIYLAKRDYKSRTGRDLIADIDANGMTPDILKALGGTWEGFQSEAGRQKAIAAFNGASSMGNVTMPVPPAAIKAFNASYDAAFTPIAERLIASYGKGVPPTEQDLADFRETYPFVSKDENKGILKKLFDAEDQYGIAKGIPQDTATLRAFVGELDNAEREGRSNPRAVKVAEVAQGYLKEQEKLRKDDPLEMGRRRWVGPGMEQTWGKAGAVPWGNYDGMVGELSLRRMQSDMIRQADGEASHMPLYEGDRKGLAAALPNMPADQAQATLAALRETFTKDQMAALMGDDAVRGAIQGLTRSPDPAKMQAGYSFMDEQMRLNPVEFRATFGESSEKMLARWQVLKDQMPAAQITELLMKSASPRDADTRKRWESDATAAMEKMTTDQIFKEVSREQSGFVPYWTGFGANRAMQPKEMAGMGYDYAQAYKSHYGEHGDEAAAKQYALSRVKINWGESVATNRMMRHPPDKHVPQVNGSHAWIKDQLQGDLMGLLKVDMTRVTQDGNGLLPPDLSATELQAVAILEGKFEILADAQTEADISNKRPPSYRIMVQTPDGLIRPMEKGPADYYRWSPDHKAASEAARPGLMQKNDTVRIMRENRVTMMPGANFANDRSLAIKEVDSDPRFSNLSFVERGFLGTLRAAESVGAGGTALRLFNDVIQRGRTEPITEQDLKPAEQEKLRALVVQHSQNNGSQSGMIDYKDYRGSGVDPNILGGFKYSIKDGNISVEDTYDFNTNRIDGWEDNRIVQMLGALANQRGLAASIGRKIIPDSGGNGVPVRIKLRAK